MDTTTLLPLQRLNSEAWDQNDSPISGSAADRGFYISFIR